MKVKIEEYEVETSVCDWWEVKISHKKINKKFIKNLIPKFKELSFVFDAFKADNGLIRLNMLGNENRRNPFLHKNTPSDICIHPNKGYCILMREGSIKYKQMEDIVISVILENLKY
jgi:hypothetical protein